jgi:rhodanese-related sulfurtransferase
VRIDDVDRLTDEGAVVVDVREPDERSTGEIAASLNVPYRLSWTADLPPAGTYVTMCETGPRAAIAASILRARGFDARPVLGGGFASRPSHAALA